MNPASIFVCLILLQMEQDDSFYCRNLHLYVLHYKYFLMKHCYVIEGGKNPLFYIFVLKCQKNPLFEPLDLIVILTKIKDRISEVFQLWNFTTKQHSCYQKEYNNLTAAMTYVINSPWLHYSFKLLSCHF